MRLVVWACAFVLCCTNSGLLAQEAGAVYRDRDPAASYVAPPPGGRARFKAAIEATLRKNPENPVALTHRAYLFNDMGDTRRALRDYDAALAASAGDSLRTRHVYWSRGWSRYDAGDVAGAITDWHAAGKLHGGAPHWLPYTLALGYWTLGESQPALQWYGVAVASNPAFGTDDGLQEKISRWDARQQAMMRSLHAAWMATQPAT